MAHEIVRSFAEKGLEGRRVRDLAAPPAKHDRALRLERLQNAADVLAGSAGIVGELLVAFAQALAGGMCSVSRSVGSTLLLEWGLSCGSMDRDFAVYEGPVGDFTAHAPALCSTRGATSATVSPAAGNRYYLVVPNDGYHGGRYGASGPGAAIPAKPTRCYPAAVATGCS